MATFALLLAVCACEPRPRPAHPQRWAKAFINALNSHRGEQTSPLLRGTGTYEDPVIGGPLSGEWLAIFLVDRWRRYPKLHYELRRVSGDAQTVVAEWSATGLRDSSSEQPVEGVFVLRVQGDAIASVRAYYNALELD